MTTEEFNLLPLETRQYIEKQKTCLGCGKSQDLDLHLKNYLAMKNGQLFTLRTGAISYKNAKGEGGILYPIHPSDSEEVTKDKLRKALELFEVAPDKFENISEEKIAKILNAEKTDEPKILFGAAKKAADKKAAEAAKKEAEKEAAEKAAKEAAEAAEKEAAEKEAAEKEAAENKDLL